MNIYLLFLLAVLTIPASIFLIKQGVNYLHYSSTTNYALKSAFDVPSLLNQSLVQQQSPFEWKTAGNDQQMYSLVSFFQDILGDQNVASNSIPAGNEIKTKFRHTSITKRMTVVNAC